MSAVALDFWGGEEDGNFKYYFRSKTGLLYTVTFTAGEYEMFATGRSLLAEQA